MQNSSCTMKLEINIINALPYVLLLIQLVSLMHKTLPQTEILNYLWMFPEENCRFRKSTQYEVIFLKRDRKIIKQASYIKKGLSAPCQGKYVKLHKLQGLKRHITTVTIVQTVQQLLQ